MTVRRDPYVVGINFQGKEFTPRDIYEYVENDKWVKTYKTDEEKSRQLIESTRANLDRLVSESNIGDRQTTTSESETGQRIAKLALDYCDGIIGLLRESQMKRGIL